MGSTTKLKVHTCYSLLAKCKTDLAHSTKHLHKMYGAKMQVQKITGKHLGEGKVDMGCLTMLDDCKKALAKSDSHFRSWGSKSSKRAIKHKVIKKKKKKPKKKSWKHCASEGG